MFTEVEFLGLLQRPEGETLDFKQDSYNLSLDDKKFDLVKDILCMANTPRDHDSHIVLGVKKYPDGRFDLLGVEQHLDEEQLQSQFVDRVYPVPRFTYEAVWYKEKSFGVITIPPERIGPCEPLRDYGKRGNFLRQHQIYFRRGSKNDIAGPEDAKSIFNWIGFDGLQVDQILQGTTHGEEWEGFLEAVHNFAPSRKYLLVTNVPATGICDQVENLGAVDWSFVVDLDPSSDRNGVFKEVSHRLNERRNVHRMVKGDRPPLNLDRGTYWFFARGLEGSPQPPELGSWMRWQQEHGNELREQIANFARASIPTPVTVVALWYGDNLVDHLQSIFEGILAAMGSSVDFVIVSDNPANVQPIVARTECEMVAMPLLHACSGLGEFASAQQGANTDVVVLPSSSGAPIVFSSSDVNWIEEEIELVHMRAGTVRDGDRDIGRDFLKGQEITWHELGLRYDVDRDQVNRVRTRIERDLSARRGVRINLYHEPGAGGTTLAKRVIWDLHERFPCGILRRTSPRATVERLQCIVGMTDQPTLLLADGGNVSDRELDELFGYIGALHLPIVLLQVLRRFGAGSSRERTVSLPSQLSPAECQRFAHALSRETPQRTAALDRVTTTQPDRHHTPFYYCLQAFGEDFQRLDSFVDARLESLTDIQKKVLVFLSIAHHYGQKSLPAQAFGPVLGIPGNQRVDLPKTLSDRGLDLVVESSKGEWRTSHDLIAMEVLRRLLWPSSKETTLWKQNLSNWAIEFARFCRGTTPVAGDFMLEVARRTFFYRDNVELLGTERSGSTQFAQLIQDVPVKEGRLEVLRTLVDVYPDQPHFWGHLGRFYAIEMKDFPKAIECADQAISFEPEDSVLHHMKGMALRSHAIDRIEQRAPLSDVIQMATQASDSFGHAREKNPDDEHGYISEVQLNSRVLDYAGSQHPGGLVGYLGDPTADPFVQTILEKSEDLLEHIRRNREGEGPSSYELECRGKLDKLYGLHDQALQVWDTLLHRRDVYSPPIRRQIVWTYLARKDRLWDELTSRELVRATELLEQNLNEEPHDDRNMRMWVQAVRRIPDPPSIESVIEKVAYWQANTGSIDATYYLYLLNAVLATEGSILAGAVANQFLDECRSRARLRRNRTKSFEWVGPGVGLSKLIHHSRLGDWERSSDFWENVRPLCRVTGRIARIRGLESGLVQVTPDLSAFFVPAKGGYAIERSENQAVEFYLGFSYDGLRAWDVRPI